jgi:hypothetical protein
MANDININNGNIAVMRAESERDRQSGSSTQARDAMEGFSPERVLGGIAEILKVLGAALSG